MRLPRLVLAVPLLLASPALVGCPETYSQDPKVAAAYAGAAAGIAVAQAVAASHSSDAPIGDSMSGGASHLRVLRDYAVRAINRIRADHSVSPLTPSASLSEFAQRGSEELEDDHEPHQHLLHDARGAHCGENQGSAHGEPAGPAEGQIDAALLKMMGSDPEARANLLSASWRFVGIGITNPGAAMYLTIDLAEVAF